MRTDLSTKTNKSMWNDDEKLALFHCHNKSTVTEATILVNRVSDTTRSEDAVYTMACKRGVRLRKVKK